MIGSDIPEQVTSFFVIHKIRYEYMKGYKLKFKLDKQQMR